MFAKNPISFAFFALNLRRNINYVVTGVIDRWLLVIVESVPLEVVNVGEQSVETVGIRGNVTVIMVLVIEPGSIINTAGRNIRFPSGLKLKYFSHFVKTSKVCDFVSKCKHKYVAFLSGFDSDDHKPMLDFVKETRGLKWYDKVSLPRHVSSTNDRN